MNMNNPVEVNYYLRFFTIIIMSEFQLGTIYSIFIVVTLVKVFRFDEILIIYVVALALFNALGYYVWDIVKSAYKQIKNENENNQSHGNYAMQSYEKPPPYNYSYQQV